MARCRITKPSTLRRLSERIGEAVISALTRGGTDHRIDCILPDGSIVSVYRDGTIERTPYKAAH